MKKIYYWLLGSKKKKIIFLSVLMFVIVLAFNLKTVPNYSNKYGFEIVTSIGYNKYQRGYCLSKNRILSAEEKFRVAILDYLKKTAEAHKIVQDDFCHDAWFGGGSSHCYYAVTYYILNELTNENWYDAIYSKFNTKDKRLDYQELFFKELNVTKIETLEDYLIFDKDIKYAGFKRPILFYNGISKYYLYLDKGFIFNNNGDDFSINGVYIRGTIFSLSDFNEDKNNYEKYTAYRLNNRDWTGHKEIDNCGNVKYDIEKIVKELREWA
jgi:hypothetical protein